MSTKLAIPTQINNTIPPEELPADLYDCTICYDKIKKENNSKTRCGHYFCRTCLDAWMNVNTTCPICRTVIKERQLPNAPPGQMSGRISIPTPRIDDIPPPRREIVHRNIMDRYTWEQYFMASNDMKNNNFILDFDDINKSNYAPVDFGNNLL